MVSGVRRLSKCRQQLRPYLVQFDRSSPIFWVILALSLAFAVPIQLNMDVKSPVEKQLMRLNPDARLYYGLAQNLVDGTGYRDTVRNREIMPSVGHPFIISVACVRLGVSPARLSWLSILLAVSLIALIAAGLLTAGTLTMSGGGTDVPAEPAPVA